MSSDDLDGPTDPTRIDVREDAEFWAGELGCSRADLRRAVAAAGPSVTAVQVWLDTTYSIAATG
ncbi:MAG: DUF3606 domain-containing protein [Dokdonella sp.]|uniref:DUF3606 domain-containing protein n=1 Tax=Dokdonella sp. TaxID=2291710 RepID=UPI003264F00C